MKYDTDFLFIIVRRVWQVGPVYFPFRSYVLLLSTLHDYEGLVNTLALLSLKCYSQVYTEALGKIIFK